MVCISMFSEIAQGCFQCIVQEGSFLIKTHEPSCMHEHPRWPKDAVQSPFTYIVCSSYQSTTET